jgi:TRAP-type transport system periplasmic protein
MKGEEAMTPHNVPHAYFWRPFQSCACALLGLFVLVATLPASALAQSAASNKVTIRFGTLWPTTRYDHRVVDGFATRVKELTRGSVEVVIYPASQMGTEREMTESVKMGALEMTSGGGGIQGFVPEVGLFYLPYMYRDFAHFEKVWTLGKSPVADKIAKLVEDKAGIKVLGYFLGGTRDTILRTRPINTLEDYRGLKIRADEAPTSSATFKALGASPVPIPYAEVYQALQTGVVDAAENPPNGLMGQKWYEVCKYVSLTDHQMVLHLEQMNLAFWKTLSPAHQKAIQQAMDEAVAQYAGYAKSERNNAIEQLKAKGMIVNEVKDKTPFARAVQGMHQEFVTKNKLEAEYKAITSN